MFISLRDLKNFTKSEDKKIIFHEKIYLVHFCIKLQNSFTYSFTKYTFFLDAFCFLLYVIENFVPIGKQLGQAIFTGLSWGQLLTNRIIRYRKKVTWCEVLLTKIFELLASHYHCMGPLFAAQSLSWKYQYEYECLEWMIYAYINPNHSSFCHSPMAHFEQIEHRTPLPAKWEKTYINITKKKNHLKNASKMFDRELFVLMKYW